MQRQSDNSERAVVISSRVFVEELQEESYCWTKAKRSRLSMLLLPIQGTQTLVKVGALVRWEQKWNFLPYMFMDKNIIPWTHHYHQEIRWWQQHAVVMQSTDSEDAPCLCEQKEKKKSRKHEWFKEKFKQSKTCSQSYSGIIL